jgi:MIP family channel proteins
MRIPIRPLAAELAGTFTFVFVGAGAVVVDVAKTGQLGLVGVSLAHAFALAVVVTATMRISGGHLNPAVTFGLWLSRKIEARSAGLYVVAQLLGGVLAALCVRALLPEMAGEVTSYGTPRISGLLTDAQAVGIEGLLTFFLVGAVFGTIVSPDAPRVAGFGVGLIYLVGMLVGGPMTGGAMNPARAFGPALVAGDWQAHLIYWVGPLLGAALAASLWRWVLLPGAHGGESL